MTTKLVRIDDELALILDPTILDKLGIDEQTEMVISSDADGIFLKPIRFAADEDVEVRTGKIMAVHSETLRKLAL